MARRLRLARCDADARADERVEQRRLAHRRPADDRDVSAAVTASRVTRSRILRRTAASAAAAASCSAARRLLPVPARDDRKLGIRHSTANCCACASPVRRDDRVFGHRQPAAPAAIPAAASSGPCRASPDRRRAAGRRRARRSPRAPRRSPPSRNTAPNTASSASARIDGRVGAAAANSPSPSRITRRGRAARATCASVSWLTRCARRRDSSPSGRSGKRSYSVSATTQLSTASPMNSSRSLCGRRSCGASAPAAAGSGRRTRDPARCARSRLTTASSLASSVASKSSRMLALATCAVSSASESVATIRLPSLVTSTSPALTESM